MSSIQSDSGHPVGKDHGINITAEGDLLNHEYDGIQEFDNPTPGWWHYLFIVTIAFSVPYFMYWETNREAPTLDVQYSEERADALRKQFAMVGELKPDEPTLMKALANKDWLAIGESIFKTQCVSCHGSLGQGIVGPNMTDDNYKNVKQLGDFTKVVFDGAADGAMPAWRSRLSSNEIILAAAYAASLRGKNVPGRPPEGEQIPAWPKAGEDKLAPAVK